MEGSWKVTHRARLDLTLELPPVPPTGSEERLEVVAVNISATEYYCLSHLDKSK